ncbi:uncharacterized protein SPPG_09572 [Spizellomyces punctatus DAOM BR117]|uniref:Uncharacterized protein n=1 Tax=Spizellomyces punctatus (strain DAOM BR117) TaxID=645134 RepID=A0A0L0H3N2_SPIPD|nr:uncharacterized protein SPPG_09572 [Spizellomyces punctatus DAOM BR117]KNC95812.1 hypothetical protein SPPG_09572 [Spizellomyces punctatus DAOM BR117]|eukprot:XP_016603852.1 hypothetical protein SPPG_09572 [Spizellomyces punctatus DAOM BR117]
MCGFPCFRIATWLEGSYCLPPKSSPFCALGRHFANLTPFSYTVQHVNFQCVASRIYWKMSSYSPKISFCQRQDDKKSSKGALCTADPSSPSKCSTLKGVECTDILPVSKRCWLNAKKKRVCGSHKPVFRTLLK